MCEDGHLHGAIEAGGTKFVCVVARGVEDILEEKRIPTRDSVATLAEVLLYFDDAKRRYGELRAIGVGSFGPLDIEPSSATYGRLLSTPKAGWTDTDIRALLMTRMVCPVAIDTDVNAAALA